MSTSSSASTTTDNGGTGTGVGTFLDRLRQMLTAMQVFAQVFALTAILTAEQRKKLAGLWAAHYAALALALADVLDFSPTTFTRLGFDGADLRAGTEEVRILTSMKAITDDLSLKILSRLAQCKGDLGDKVSTGVTEVHNLMESKLTDPKLVESLNPVVLPMNKIVDEANKSRQAVKGNNSQLKAEGEQKAQAVEQDLLLKKLELLVKDGQPLTLDDLATATPAAAKAKTRSQAKARKPPAKSPATGTVGLPVKPAATRRSAKR